MTQKMAAIGGRGKGKPKEVVRFDREGYKKRMVGRRHEGHEDKRGQARIVGKGGEKS